jgi:flagellar motor protein MotB
MHGGELIMNDQWEFYKDVGDAWRWRRVDGNGTIVGTSTGGYPKRSDCEENARHNGWSDEGARPNGEAGGESSDVSEESREQRRMALELFKEHGFADGNAYVAWLGAEKLKADRSIHAHQRHRMVLMGAFIGILCVVVAVMLVIQFTKAPPELMAEISVPDVKVVTVVLDPKVDEKVVVFGDVHFEYGESHLSLDAKALLDQDVQDLKDHPTIDVRMAGYTSGGGSEENNQMLSERRANAVRDYLIEGGISSERITVIGYGRTRPAVFEVKPVNTRSKEALANMRVLFEVVVK